MHEHVIVDVFIFVYLTKEARYLAAPFILNLKSKVNTIDIYFIKLSIIYLFLSTGTGGSLDLCAARADKVGSGH